MSRNYLKPHFDKVDYLATKFEEHVPDNSGDAAIFRGDLAGLLVVAMSASYENCVKDVMVNHALDKNKDFHYFIDKKFEKLNSRIAVNDLNRYSKLFGEQNHQTFKENLSDRKFRIEKKTGINIETSYGQILKWRHAYAHTGKKETTIEEAIKVHCYAKRVIYCFDEAF